MTQTISISLSDLGALLNAGSLEISTEEDRIVLEMKEKSIPRLIKAYTKYSHFILIPIQIIRAGKTHVHLIGVSYKKKKREKEVKP
ncbi:TPA_asm: hypothetical protein vir520_00039 [Caudoviricetes sp. vir520]|nr:TPA_asm: hypothetical protein vir520_00039 [Caudoviricetes sp. vir520]